MRFGRRTAAILRAFNLRCGIGPEVEYPSERYGSQPVDGPAKEHNVMAQWEHMLDVWYETVGYDRKTGKPKHETLRRRSGSTGSPKSYGEERPREARRRRYGRPRRRAAAEGEASARMSRAERGDRARSPTWVTKHVGGDGSGTRTFDGAVRPRATLCATLLRRFSRRFPELDAALWNPRHTPSSASPSRWSSTTPCSACTTTWTRRWRAASASPCWASSWEAVRMTAPAARVPAQGPQHLHAERECHSPR